MAEAASSRVRIGRFQLNCLVPTGHPAPDRVRTHLTSIVEAAVPGALSSIFANALPGTDESIWIIRELQLSADLSLTTNTRQAAHSIAAEAARVLTGEMIARDSNNVVRFQNPSDYLAAFLADVAAGFAWERWYFRGFDGLRLLPTSAAIRTAICDDPGIGLSALHHLSNPAARNVVRRLTDGDATRVLDRMRNSSSRAASEEEWIDPILEALRSASLPASPEQTALTVFIEVSRSIGGDMATGALWSLCLSRLKDGLVEGNSQRRAQWIAALRSPDSDTSGLFARAADSDALLSLRQLRESTRLRILEGLTAGFSPAAAPDSSNTIGSWFGGAFFLLPLIDDLFLEASTKEATAAVRWLVLVKCFGPHRSPEAVQDPLLRNLTGADPRLSPRELCELVEKHADLEDLTRHMRPSNEIQYFLSRSDLGLSPAFDLSLSVLAEGVIRAFAAKLPGFASSTASYLQENFLDCAVSVEFEDDRCVAILGAAPLNLVLSIAGINRQQYKLSWRGGLRFELYSQSA